MSCRAAADAINLMLRAHQQEREEASRQHAQVEEIDEEEAERITEEHDKQILRTVAIRRENQAQMAHHSFLKAVEIQEEINEAVGITPTAKAADRSESGDASEASDEDEDDDDDDALSDLADEEEAAEKFTFKRWLLARFIYPSLQSTITATYHSIRWLAHGTVYFAIMVVPILAFSATRRHRSNDPILRQRGAEHSRY